MGEDHAAESTSRNNAEKFPGSVFEIGRLFAEYWLIVAIDATAIFTEITAKKGKAAMIAAKGIDSVTVWTIRLDH